MQAVSTAGQSGCLAGTAGHATIGGAQGASLHPGKALYYRGMAVRRKPVGRVCTGASRALLAKPGTFQRTA